MSSSLHSSLIVLAVLATAANAQAAGKAHHQTHKASTHVSHTKAAAKAHRAALHHARKAPRQVSRSKVIHHRRPAVHRRSVQSVRRATTRIVRQPVRRAVVRTVNRYPVRRVQRSFLSRPNIHVRHSRHQRYTYFYYPGQYQWRSNHYNRRLGAGRRHGARGIRGIVESVQGNPANGTLLVKAIRPRTSRFRFTTARAGAARGGTSLHRFLLDTGTRYEVLTAPPRGGSITDLHKGEHVMIVKRAKAANAAQTVQVSPQRKR
jgi:hypothetical protein